MRLYRCLLSGLVLAAAPITAQWKNLPAKTDLAAPAPKAADGKPDLSGIWEPDGVKFLRTIAADLKIENVPMRPEARRLLEARADGAKGNEEPDASCLPQGVPKINAAPVPWKIVQTPNLVVIIYEAFNLWRQIHLDGRQLIDDPNPTWLGYSVGRWEGDTLVVESRGFNGKTWLDSAGLPTSEKLRVTERFRRKDFGHMELQITIDDPTFYTRPFTVTESPRLVTGTELLEFICGENEKDLVHMNK
jgi:hypothetical protein